MNTTPITANTVSSNPLSSLNPDSPLGYFRLFLADRDAQDFKQEASSLLEALPDAEGYTDAQVELTEKVLERIVAWN